MTVNKEFEILELILQKEAAFISEIDSLAQNLQTDDLSDYLKGLKDLKNDFLIPLKQRLADNTKETSSVFSEKYWFWEKT